MLTACEQVKHTAGTQNALCEVFAISESSVDGGIACNILWVEWEGGTAYRKGIGRILKSEWVAQKPEVVDLILG